MSMHGREVAVEHVFWCAEHGVPMRDVLASVDYPWPTEVVPTMQFVAYVLERAWDGLPLPPSNVIPFKRPA